MKMPINRRVPTLAGAALATLLVACGGDSPSGLRSSVDGTYSLTSINGQSLPFTTESTTTTTIQVVSGQRVATSQADGSLEIQTTEVDRTTTQPGSTVTVDTLRKTENVSFDGTNFATSQYAGTIRGDSMTIYSGAFTYAYVRGR